MSVIGNLTVTLTADTEKFSRGMKKARTELSAFDKAATTALASIKSTFAGFGAAFVAGFSINAIRQTIHELDELSDSAKRLGVSVRGLAGLQYSGSLTGLSDASMTSALTKMQKSIGDNSKAFKALGLSVAELKNLDADEQFIRIAEALNKMPTAAERTANAMKIFGRNAAELFELMGKGRAGITADQREAGLMGLAPTDEELKQIEKADRAMRKLGKTWEGVKRDIATTTAEPAAQVMEDAQGLIGFLNRIDDFVFGFFRDRWRDMRGYTIPAPPKRPPSTAAYTNMKEMAGGIASGYSPSGALSGMLGSMAASPLGFAARAGSLWDFMVGGGAVDKSGAKAWAEMADPEYQRIAGLLGPGGSGNAPPEIVRRQMHQVRGNAALEYGSAAAFSQERRSGQASQMMELQKKELKQSEQQTKALQNIDKNLAKVKQLEIVNIA